MAKITKSALAAELGISRQRVTQYADRGMPILGDGKLDREAAIAWIKRNVDPTTSSTGYFAAAESRTRGRRDDSVNPVTAGMNSAVGCMFAIIPGIAAAAAREAGASDEQIERIWALAHQTAKQQGNAVMVRMLGLEPRGDYWPDIDMCKHFTMGDVL